MEISNRSHYYFINSGQKKIDFLLQYSNRKTMEIAVHPNGKVIVKAPEQSKLVDIETKVRKRARWIIRQLKYFEQFNPRVSVRCYVNGETHRYLGKQYRLKLIEGKKNTVKLSRGFFYITCEGHPTPEVAKKLLNAWYMEKARFQFSESVHRCWDKFSRQGISTKPNLSIRRMKTRWGSLSHKGTMTLNVDLVKAPKECIDYVVIHELCHLKYYNHSPDFYKLLESIMPEWKKIKHMLELSMS
ncbi:SprT family zinc-dependent metalloprotease [Otariodibacter sp.]|uniref:M48 family metallopeptidase n=1 Tax=Otariodibacter sp. TaxID=3030919 RepID=UPI00260C450E|nr:SprT family zinc-dependent metalloprotease [Otariodibacter sp.]